MKDLQVGTTIKFNNWNDELMVGDIVSFDNGTYKVSVNNRNLNVSPSEIIEVVNKQVFEPVYVEPIQEPIEEQRQIVKDYIIQKPKIEEPIEEPIEELIEEPIEEKIPAFQGLFADGGYAKIIENLPNELTIYIPLFDYNDNPASDSEINERVNDVKDFLKNHFGEYVVQQMGSSFIDYEGNLKMQKHIQISAYPTDEEFESNKQVLVNQASLWATDWLQLMMVLEYEEDMFFIMPMQDMMKQGGELWIQDAVKQMKKKGTLGAFTKQAKREGLTPIAFAKKVLKNPKAYTLKTRRRAMFVKNTNPEKF